MQILFNESMVWSDDERYVLGTVCASMVGSVIFAVVCSRLNIAQATGAIKKYMANQGRDHWVWCEWIIRYLKGISNTSIYYFGQTLELVGFVGEDFVCDQDKKTNDLLLGTCSL